MDIFLVQLLTQSQQLLVFLFQLSSEVIDGLLELSTLQGTAFQLFLQLGNQLSVLLHALGNKLDVFLEILFFACTLAILQQGDTIFCLINQAESFFDVIQRAHHFIDFTVFLSDNIVQRVCLLNTRQSGSILAVLTTCHQQGCAANHKK